MKKVRFLLSVLALSLAAGACSTSIVAPECQDEASCKAVPDSGN